MRASCGSWWRGCLRGGAAGEKTCAARCARSAVPDAAGAVAGERAAAGCDALIDAHLDAAHVYTQVPAFAASDRGMLDLLSVDQDGRLAVIELKADEDLHLALQGLDYWMRVRWHHLQTRIGGWAGIWAG